MKVYFGGDHAGFELKKDLMEYVKGLGHEVEDLGPFKYEVADDYPDFVVPLAKKVAAEPGSRGIVTAGSGQGEVIAANRIPGARAVVYYGGRVDIVKVTREHNDSNILSIGARFIGEEEAKMAVKIWLEAPYDPDERHVRRIAKIEKLTS